MISRSAFLCCLVCLFCLFGLGGHADAGRPGPTPRPLLRANSAPARFNTERVRGPQYRRMVLAVRAYCHVLLANIISKKISVK